MMILFCAKYSLKGQLIVSIFIIGKIKCQFWHILLKDQNCFSHFEPKHILIIDDKS